MKDSKILDLQFVVMDDIVFKNIPFEDRINTKLTLSDYDWMNYVFETEFRTKNQGRLKVEIKYYGSKESEMNVKRIDTIGVFEYTYFFFAVVRIITSLLSRLSMIFLISASDFSPVTIAPRITPLLRKITVSSLVSMPHRPTTPCSFRKSSSVFSHLKFEGKSHFSRTISAFIAARSDSISSPFVP